MYALLLPPSGQMSHVNKDLLRRTAAAYSADSNGKVKKEPKNRIC